LDANCFTYSTHSPTSDNTGSGRSWLEEDLTTTELCIDFVRNRSFLKLNWLEVLDGSTGSLANALSNFVCLTEAEPNFAFSVSGNDESGEAEATSTFHYLGASVNEDDFFSQLITFAVGRDFTDELAAWATTTATVSTATVITSAIIATTVVLIVLVIITRLLTFVISCRCRRTRWLSFALRLWSFVICHFRYGARD